MPNLLYDVPRNGLAVTPAQLRQWSRVTSLSFLPDFAETHVRRLVAGGLAQLVLRQDGRLLGDEEEPSD